MRDLSIAVCRLSAIRAWRALFLQELNAQCRYDAAHTRKGTTQYLVRQGGRAIGYGALKDMHESRGTVFEFYVAPMFRKEAPALLRSLGSNTRPNRSATSSSTAAATSSAPAASCFTTIRRSPICSWRFGPTRAAAATDRL